MNPLRKQLLPAYARGVPGPVAEADTEAAEATLAVERAAAALSKAEQEAKAAAGVDTAAATEAVRAGKPVPAGTEAKARETLERAQRAFVALKREAAEAMRARDRHVADALQTGDWIEAQHEIADELLAEIDELAGQLADTYARLGDQSAILDALYRRRDLARLPKTPEEGRWDRRKPIGTPSRRQRPDGTIARTGEPIPARPDALVAALPKLAREMVSERDAPAPTDEEIRRREDFEQARRGWQRLASGGVFPGRG